MRIRPKSQHELNSQAIAHGAEFNTAYSREELFAIAQEDIGRVAMHAAYDQYLDALRHGQLRESINQRTDLQQSYDERFRPSVRELRDTLSGADNKQGVKEFIASGTQANVYAISHDGADYVARVSKYVEDGDAIWADKYTAGMLAVKDVLHFEQIAAVSYEEGVVISERMPGEQIDRLTVEDIEGIDNAQLHELVDTLKIAHDRAIRLDTIPGNYMYDKTAGFGLIDLELERHTPSGQRASFGRKIELTAEALRQVGEKPGGTEAGADTQEYYDSKARLLKARMELLSRFERAVGSVEIDEKERERATNKINQEIYFLDRELQELRDPQAVATMIEQAKMRLESVPPVESVAQQVYDESIWEMPEPTVKF